MSPQEPPIPSPQPPDRLNNIILGRMIYTHRKKMIQSNFGRVDRQVLKDRLLKKLRTSKPKSK